MSEYLKESTGLKYVAYSLFQFHEMLQSKCVAPAVLFICDYLWLFICDCDIEVENWSCDSFWRYD